MLTVLAGYLIAYSAWLSLHTYNLKRSRVFDFFGLQNYISIVQSEEFWSALWITATFTGLVVGGSASDCSMGLSPGVSP